MITQKNAEFFKRMNTPTISKAFPNSSADTLAVQIGGDFSDGKFHIEGRNNLKGDLVLENLG